MSNSNASGQMGMDEFADHDPSARGARAGFLDWKDEDKGKVNVWLVDYPYKVWRHSWLRLYVSKDKDGDETTKIGMMRWNTMEPAGKDEEHIKRLRKQSYYYDADPNRLDERRTPELDPFLKMLEWVFRAVITGAIDWLDPVFEYVPDDKRDTRVIHAGGLLRMYPKNFDEFDKDEISTQKAKFKAAGVSLSESFKESGCLGLKYILPVLNNDEPEEGAQIVEAAEALGNGIKRLYKDRLVRFKNDKAKADLRQNCCMQWIFDNDKNFSEKYRVVELAEEPSPEVMEQFEKEPPEMSSLTGPGNVALLKLNFETHWVHAVVPPWEELFAPAFEHVKGTPLAELPESFGYGANASSGSSSSSKSEDAKTDPPPADAGPQVPCEACGRDMPESAMVCPHCDAHYVNVGAFVCLVEIPCEACGKPRPSVDMTCPHCKAEFEIGPDKIQLKPKEEPIQARAPRRQAARSKSAG